MFEPGRIIDSVMSSGSIPGGMKSTVLAEVGGGGVVELEEETWRRRERLWGGRDLEERENREWGL